MTFVLNNNGKRLMPMSDVKARKFLKSGKAKIYKHRPFTIILTYHANEGTQDIEITEDTGSLNIGVSIKSEKHEYKSAEYKLLKDEKERHDDRRKYKNARRSRIRHRQPHFNNKNREKGYLSPSIRHKKNAHVDIIKMYLEVCSITSATLEMGHLMYRLLWLSKKEDLFQKEKIIKKVQNLATIH